MCALAVEPLPWQLGDAIVLATSSNELLSVGFLRLCTHVDVWFLLCSMSLVKESRTESSHFGAMAGQRATEQAGGEAQRSLIQHRLGAISARVLDSPAHHIPGS